MKSGVLVPNAQQKRRQRTTHHHQPDHARPDLAYCLLCLTLGCRCSTTMPCTTTASANHCHQYGGRTTDAVDASHFLSALRELLTSGERC